MKTLWMLFIILNFQTIGHDPRLPEDAAINYYDLKEWQILKTEDFPVHFVKRVILINKEPNKHERLFLAIDIRTYRIMAAWHQKTDGKKLENIGCHADLDYLETFGVKTPRWITFQSHCREEIDNFLDIFIKLFKEKKEIDFNTS
jgi:hypothetical protein